MILNDFVGDCRCGLEFSVKVQRSELRYKCTSYGRRYTSRSKLRLLLGNVYVCVSVHVCLNVCLSVRLCVFVHACVGFCMCIRLCMCSDIVFGVRLH